MKKVTSWFLLMTLICSLWALPLTVSAEETVTEEGTTTEDTTTEDTASKQVVHFNYDFEDYATTGTLSFPNSKTTGVTGGSWETLMSSAGSIVQGVDGNAFHISKDADTGMYATYNPTANVESGKWLWSFDVAYNVESTNGRVAWLMNNSSPKYLYFLALQHPTSTTVSSITAAQSRSNGNLLNQGDLFKATDSETEYTVDVLMDFDNNLATYYVNGVQKTSNKMTAAATWTFAGTTFKLNLNNNINKIDNFRLIENPDAKFSFSQKGDVTTESDTITVRFSDTVRLTDTTDFIITDGDGATVATVTAIEQVNGKFYNLKLSNTLAAGSYNLTLNDSTLTSVIAGTTASNTASAFTVKPKYTYFDVDFEEFTNAGATAYFSGFSSDKGTMALPSAGSCDFVASNTYQFAGDNTKGVKGSGSNTTKRLNYTFKEGISSGVLRVSFDAAFDSTKKSSRGQLLFINGDTTNGNIMFYGKTTTPSVIASVNTSLKYADASENIAYTDNQPYHWDIVMDLDNKKLTHYRDGEEFASLTYTRAILPVTQISLYFTPAFSFFDNYKVTLNVDDFGYTASDIDELSDATILNFDDTMVNLDASKLIFKDPTGFEVTPTSITQITPRKYKVVLPERIAGTYTVALADGVTSAIGNTPKIASASFNVEKPLEDAFIATDLQIAEATGGATLTATLTNTSVGTRYALLLIAVYDEDGMVECHAERVEVGQGAIDAVKSTTYTASQGVDLTGKTVKGFVWNIDETFYGMHDDVTL